jgi:SAM-dependent methyltransferase
MDWRAKALAQLLFSHLPYGETLNYWCQVLVTGGLPVSDAIFRDQDLPEVKSHLARLRAHSSKPLGEAIFYEFGTGWDLISALILWSMGINSQLTIDLRPMVRPALANSVIDQLNRLGPGLGVDRLPLRLLPAELEWKSILLREYGIRYVAPCDARQTGLEQGSVDFVTSTNTLEHVPGEDILALLKECRRLLKDDGLVSLQIDYQDHYSYFDKRISAYNYLRFNDDLWRKLYSPSLHYQNRLRHSDYRRLMVEAGFVLLEETTLEASSEELSALETMRLAPRFLRYDTQDLAIKKGYFVLGKREGYPGTRPVADGLQCCSGSA